MSFFLCKIQEARKVLSKSDTFGTTRDDPLLGDLLLCGRTGDFLRECHFEGRFISGVQGLLYLYVGSF